MYPTSWANGLTVLSFATVSLAGAPLLCTPPYSSSYESQVRHNSAQFHINFDKGDMGRKANGPMAAVDIYWTANNLNYLGRAPFVKGLLSFDGPFPDLQIHDAIHVVDGNVASQLYYFQGTQDGEYNGQAATGRKIEILNGEIFNMDQNALLSRLISVNELDFVQLQITGQQNITTFQNITLLTADNQQTSAAYRAKIRMAAAQFNANFNQGKAGANKRLARADVTVTTDRGVSSGRDALVALFTRYRSALPDLLAHDEYVLADGHYAATESLWQGTRTGPFHATNGTTVPPDGLSYRTRVLRWFKFDDAGLVTHVWQVATNDDFLTNVQD